MLNFSVKRYIFSFLFSFAISAAILAVLSITFYFFSPPNWLYSGLMRGFGYFSACLAAFFSTVRTEKNGLLKGCICADIYILILILAGIVILENSLPIASIVKIFGICSVLGAISGVVGVNMKKA